MQMNNNTSHMSDNTQRMRKIKLRSLEVYPFSDADALIDFANERKGILVAVNALKIANANEVTIPIVNNNIGYCDGYGAVKAAHVKGAGQCAKIPGCELWLKIIDRFHKTYTFYVVGASPQVHDAVITKLRAEYPGIRIVGHRDGYIKDNVERQALIDDVADNKPDVVFVAMGSPKQEILMSDMLKRHRAIYQGLGGSFDVYTGAVPRAPKWWLDHNMEFVYRLLRQPKRLGRNLKYIPFAWWLVTRQI